MICTPPAQQDRSPRHRGARFRAPASASRLASGLGAAAIAAALMAGCSADGRSEPGPVSPAPHSSATHTTTGAVVAVTVPADRAPATVPLASTVRIVGVHRGSEDLPLTGQVIAVRAHADLITVDVVPQNFTVDGDTELLTTLTNPPSPLSLVQLSGPITTKEASAE